MARTFGAEGTLTALTHDWRLRRPFSWPALAKVDPKHHLNLRGKHRSTSDVALCSGLAPLANNHFGRGALLRGRLRLHAINATALIEETVTTAAPNRGRCRCHGSFAGRLNTPARTNSRQPGAMNFARDGARQVGPPRHTPERTLSRNASAPDRMSRCVPAEGRDAVSPWCRGRLPGLMEAEV